MASHNTKTGPNDAFRVIELFETLQGEGTDIGRETIFMRLYGCNLKCVWCDTAYSWDESKYFKGIYKKMKQDDILDTVVDLAIPRGIRAMVITGGEPLMHNHIGLTNLIKHLKQFGMLNHFTFETNGTLIPSSELIRQTTLFSVSPKLASSKNPPFKAEMLDKWMERVFLEQLQFKFVIADIDDAVEVAELLQKATQYKYDVPIIFQPEESANNYTKLPELITEAFNRVGLRKSQWNIRYIPQVHKLFKIR